MILKNTDKYIKLEAYKDAETFIGGYQTLELLANNSDQSDTDEL